MMLNEEEKRRYSRHLMMEEVGETGQKKLKHACVLIIGSGALASPNALYLAGAGVGRIGIIDDDVVDVSNLHRQILYTTEDIGKPKVERAKARMLALNPNIEVQTYRARFTLENAEELVRGYDFIIDATDNFVSKFLINDACVLQNKPFIHAGIMRHCGQLMGVIPHQSACLACIFPQAPKDMALYQNGLFAPIAGVLGTLSANEALKFFTHIGSPLLDRILSVNLSNLQISSLKVTRNPNCPICSAGAKKEIRPISCEHPIL